jgi:REP element-mobilizing transposase RayT
LLWIHVFWIGGAKRKELKLWGEEDVPTSIARLRASFRSDCKLWERTTICKKNFTQVLQSSICSSKENSMIKPVEQHRRYLPHYQEEERCYSITWRREGSLPKQVQEMIRQMKALSESLASTQEDDQRVKIALEYRNKLEDYDLQLGAHHDNGIQLTEPIVAEIIGTAFRFYDGKDYRLITYCIMPNHIHLLIKPMQDQDGSYAHVSEIVRKLKSYSSRQILKQHPGERHLWRADYFDRFIRGENDYWHTVEYILNNPVKAKMAKKWQDWPFSYQNARFWEGSR